MEPPFREMDWVRLLCTYDNPSPEQGLDARSTI